MTSPTQKTPNLIVGLMIALGIVSNVLLVSWLDTQRAHAKTGEEIENLYLDGETARRLSLSFNGLVADWYWMRSLQYVGNKLINAPEDVVIDDLSKLDMRLLAPLLDAATTLDPQFLEPYEYAAVVLPGIDDAAAIRITNKGIAANPGAWRLYQHLGYIYWQQHDYKKASETYAVGSQIQGAPVWMEAMSARMAAEGGSRSVAREIYNRMYDQASDDKVREMARRRLLQLASLDEREALRNILVAFEARIGHCPSSWTELATIFTSRKIPTDRNGSPLDPSGAPYLLREDCKVELDPSSEVPPR